MDFSIVLDVMQFELKRSLTKGRILIWCALVAFPVALLTLVERNNPTARVEEWGFLLYVLVPEMVCLLGLLLWATPSISTEIEGQTWIYLAMRSSGRSLVLVGKYLTAVVWSLSAALASISLCMFVVDAIGGAQLWTVLSLLAALSCFAHAAIFVLIGVLFPKRAMVTAVFYTLAIEYGVSLVPALANKLTVNYRLRGLLANWMEWDDVRSQAELVFGNEANWVHLLVLFAITSTILFAAIFWLRRAEYPTQQDG